ncbi:MAG: nodulation protein NfeD [Gammaproteobacteria bacterium]|nr:nodulation protein NfeD [Gammaproteobacteria bacterium]
MSRAWYFRRFLRLLSSGLLVAGCTLLLAAGEPDSTPAEGEDRKLVIELTIADAIGPAISDYIQRGLEQAVERRAEVVILRLDTPGGLDTSMRQINQAIIDSPVPVVTYVHPSGARAASAGTYMLYASHIAAMAPGTNLGAATPVQLGGGGGLPGPADQPEKRDRDKDGDQDTTTDNGEDTAAETDEAASAPGGSDAMSRKMINDSVAYIRSLAELRGRNAEWAEKAVREAASLSANEALARNVVNVIAANSGELLEAIDGYTVTVRERQVELNTENTTVESFDQDWRTELLAVITNPNIVYLLMLVGFYGLIFELANPGYILPGVTGAICLIIALYALQVLPVNYAGVALILLGLAFMTGEMFVPSFGALGIGGLIAFVIGSIILFETDRSSYEISIWLIGSASVLSGLVIMAAMGLLIRSHRRRVVTGSEEMIGSVGRAIEDFEGEGRVFVHGEIWRCHSDQRFHVGDSVRVVSRNGLLLEVEPYKSEEN